MDAYGELTIDSDNINLCLSNEKFYFYDLGSSPCDNSIADVKLKVFGLTDGDYLTLDLLLDLHSIDVEMSLSSIYFLGSKYCNGVNGGLVKDVILDILCNERSNSKKLVK